MYANEAQGEIDTLPTLLGTSMVNADISELQTLGWSFVQ
jgi:hypothetical protein